MSFDLEKGIAAWRAKLRKHRGFEDADIDELEDHLRSKIDDKVSSGLSHEDAFDHAMSEDYDDLPEISGQYLSGRSLSNTSLGLLANYFKVGFRSFGRARTYFAINLAGLVIGIASALFIVSYLRFEFSYDDFNANKDNIYRVNTHFERASGGLHYPIIPPAVGPAIKDNFAGIVNTTRLRYSYSVLMKHEDRSFYEQKVFFAEPAFLEMFSFDWIAGQPAGALSDPNTIVLTKSMANKYFGDTNPIGEVIRYDNDIDLHVIGLIEDVPENSHVTFDCLVSFETFQPGPGSLEGMTSWKWLGFLTYVQLEEEVVIEDMAVGLAEMFKSNNNSQNNLTVEFELQPLTDIYLTSGGLRNPQGGLFRINDKDNLISLGVIALLIIGISFFNYFNITSALLRTRTKEIGIRKVFGASKSKVLVHFAIETFSMVVLATILATAMFYYINRNEAVDVGFIAMLDFMLIGSFTLLSGMLFGGTFSVHSALVLLKNKMAVARTRLISLGGLVLVLQFGISAALIMISFVIVNQLSFFSQKDLGYEKEGLIMAKFGSEEMNARRNLFQDAMTGIPSVKAVSFGPALDGSTSGNPLRLNEWSADQVIQTSYFGVDYEFQEALGLEVLEGRFFSRQRAQDSVSSILINERLAAMLGVDDPIGKKVQFTSGEFEIIGIFKDFHYQSLHHEIGPLALEMWLGQPRSVMIRYESDDIAGTLQDLGATWQQVFADGGFPFDYRFLDEQLQSMYGKEQEFAGMLKIFTGLAIFLALLGLFGVSSINIQQRIRQIGIRRVLGAELSQIAKVVSSRYLVTALLGILLSLPLAFLAMQQWLSNYAYSIDLGIGYPLLTLVIVLGITVLTMAFQVYRVMHVNPSTILRDE
ncbi:MAG: ABC transporter permease [Cyclobacteriaceae bacterium]